MAALLVFIQGALEITGILAFNFALLRVRWDWTKTVMMGVVFSVMITFFRALPIPFGVHTLVTFLIFFVYIRKTTQRSSLKISATILSSLFVLTGLELLIHGLFIRIFNITSDELIADHVLWKLQGMPQGIIMIILAVVISKILTPPENEDKYLSGM